VFCWCCVGVVIVVVCVAMYLQSLHMKVLLFLCLCLLFIVGIALIYFWKQIKEAEGIIVWHLSDISKDMINNYFGKAKVLVRVGMGYDNVDLEQTGNVINYYYYCYCYYYYNPH